MIFIILTSVLLAISVRVLVRAFRRRRDVGWAFAVVAMVLVLGGLFAVVLPLSITAQFAGTSRVSTDFPLRALAVGDGIQGQFFLGSGSVDGERVLNYVVQRDGYATLEQVDADKALIFEGEGTPHVESTERVLDAWWAAPFPLIGMTTGYQFHIPAGSIIESYSVQ